MLIREPVISVGILTADKISVTLHGEYRNLKTGGNTSGELSWNSESFSEEEEFIPLSEGAFFDVRNVVIGIRFHWERKEDQRFEGGFRIIRENGRLTVVNLIGTEKYLTSVISSELNADSPPQSLRAHAVISRSWLIRQLEDKQGKTPTVFPDPTGDAKEYVRWYDREEHEFYDVCSDDHCQRYQGISRITSPTAREAVASTRGKVLTDGKRVCDARYSKCCGGVSEPFETVWEPVMHPYLVPVRDTAEPGSWPELTEEIPFRQWVSGSPESFCNTSDREKLAAILNGYDRETADFYRWTVEYSQKELSCLIGERLGVDFGTITALTPLERGPSGRIIRLRITGTLRELVIGKELLIRKALSKSHLYSSAFTVDTVNKGGHTVFILRGAGWGHGVGLCQIGAGMMGFAGYKYPEILAHYYPGTTIEKIW